MRYRVFERRTHFMILIAGTIFHQAAHATTLLEFDDPYLIAEEMAGKIRGYYGLTLPAVAGIRGSVSCQFFFESEGGSANGAKFTIRTFFTKNTFEHRHIEEDLNGRLIVDRNSWLIEMEEVPGGCSTAAGGGFQKDHAIPNIVQKRTPIAGLFLVKKRTNFYDLKDSKLVKRKGFLIPGDVIIAFNQKDDFYFVKFLNVQNDQTSTGWVKVSDTTNPFGE